MRLTTETYARFRMPLFACTPPWSFDLERVIIESLERLSLCGDWGVR